MPFLAPRPHPAREGAAALSDLVGQKRCLFGDHSHRAGEAKAMTKACDEMGEMAVGWACREGRKAAGDRHASPSEVILPFGSCGECHPSSHAVVRCKEVAAHTRSYRCPRIYSFRVPN